MITSAELKEHSIKELGKIAERRGVSRWKTMKKDELVRAIVRASKVAPRAKSAPAAKTVKKTSVPAPATARKANTAPARTSAASSPKTATHKRHPVAPRAIAKIQRAHAQRVKTKDLSSGQKASKDRIVLMVRDAYWLHACWNITEHSVTRAEAAMAEQWHTAKPVLRLLEVHAGSTTNSAERVVREYDIHGGVTNWYIDIIQPQRSFRVEIGYKGGNGKIHTLCRSNIITMPAPGSSDAIDRNWADVAENYERVYALSGGYSDESPSGELQELFEERLRRPMGNALGTRFGSGAEAVLRRHRDFEFNVDAEMIVYGSTKADSRVTVGGEPIKVRADGTFTLRLAMPDKRQVIPVVAASADGVEQRTVVLAIERNTKVLEPMMKDAAE